MRDVAACEQRRPPTPKRLLDMMQTYLTKQYSEGKVRKARVNHICNGDLSGLDPGCGAQIRIGQFYFDTGERDDKFRAGRFCARCAMMCPGCDDLFADNRPELTQP